MAKHKLTIKDKLFEMLTDQGAQVVLTTSRKYQKLTVPGQHDQFYWLGPSGALRRGRTVTESSSFEQLRAGLLKQFDTKHSK